MRHGIETICKAHGYEYFGDNNPDDEIYHNEKTNIYVLINKHEEEVMFYYIDEEDGEPNSTLILSTEEAKLKNELMERIHFENDRGTK